MRGICVGGGRASSYTQIVGKGSRVAPMLDEVSCIEDNAQAGQDLAHFATS